MAWQQNASWTPLRADDLADQGLQLDHDYPRGTFASHRQQWEAEVEEEPYEMRDFGGSHRLLLEAEGDAFKDLHSNQHSHNCTTSAKKWRLTGWKVGVLACAAVAGMVCFLNIGLTVWAIHNHQVKDELSYLFTGSCTEVASISLWIHLAINAMGTLLLSASNYTMQVISSPTRKDIDIAHKKSQWLDIGVPSVRNLSSLPVGRVFMWMILALSSIPLHLMYNTAVFSSLAANNYNYIIATESFLNSTPVYNGTTKDVEVTAGIISIMNQEAIAGSLVRYEPLECQTAYGEAFVSRFRNVVLITTDKNATNNVLGGGLASIRNSDGFNAAPYSWICGDGYTTSPWSTTINHTLYGTERTKSTAANFTETDGWKLFGHRIGYCMVEEVVEH